MNVRKKLAVLVVASWCGFVSATHAGPPDRTSPNDATPVVPGVSRAAEPSSPLRSADRIVVAASRNGKNGLFVSGDDDEDWRRLTSGPQDLVPRWSPGGDRIAFLTARATDAAVQPPDLAFHWFLETVRPDGTERARVTPVPVSLSYEWSPDGAQLVFASSHEDERNRGIDGIVSSAIHVVDIDGENLHRLTEVTGMARSPAWSPDGRHLGWIESGGGSSELVVADADGTSRRALIRNALIESPPVWSPDGKRIAVLCRARQNNEGLRFVTLDSETAPDEPTLAEDAATGRPIQWTEAGFLLLKTKTGCAVLDVRGEIPTATLANPPGRMLDPQLTGAGTGIYFRSIRNGRLHLLRSSTDGRRHVDLTGSLQDVSSFDVLPAAGGTKSIQGHTGTVRDVAISPDRQWVISCSTDRTIRRRNLLTLREQGRINSDMSLQGVGYFDDDASFVYGTGLLLCDFRNERLTRTIQPLVRDCAILDDPGEVVIASSGNRLERWNVRNRSKSEPFPQATGYASLHRIAGSADGARLITAGVRRSSESDAAKRTHFVSLWDGTRRWQQQKLEGHNSNYRINAVAMTRDGSRAIAASANGDVLIWNSVSGELLHRVRRQGTANDLAVSLDGNRVLVAMGQRSAGPPHPGDPGENLVVHLDLANGVVLDLLRGHAAEVTCVALSPHGRFAVSGDSNGVLHRWTLPDQPRRP
ncbi:translocation protein TolB [Maioricimonas rarisocia]|uniref:Translocation protein TolB n=1 Tax=Maioricimonas rarisocia TaxID=2528026 RepID=A0A517Z4X8_9PLAN|nr:PD40 domain-containing protein [Maioricimonas rarisocia]QDU37514.1 translocation protein TolB [Maioricimonas rarisocia]